MGVGWDVRRNTHKAGRCASEFWGPNVSKRTHSSGGKGAETVEETKMTLALMSLLLTTRQNHKHTHCTLDTLDV